MGHMGSYYKASRSGPRPKSLVLPTRFTILIAMFPNSITSFRRTSTSSDRYTYPNPDTRALKLNQPSQDKASMRCTLNRGRSVSYISLPHPEGLSHSIRASGGLLRFSCLLAWTWRALLITRWRCERLCRRERTTCTNFMPIQIKANWDRHQCSCHKS